MMKTIRRITILLSLLPAHALFAQATRPALENWVSTAEKAVVDVANAMPAETYGFAPTNGEFAGVRTFGEQLKHLAANNYAAAAFIEGRTPSADQLDESGPPSVKTKSDIVGYVRGSFAALHKAVATLDDGKAAALAPGDKHNPIWYVIDAAAHSFDHYGQLVEYLRMNGIVPPASRKTVAESPLACDRLALSPEVRKRHFEELGPALVKLRRNVRELPDGYEFEFPSDPKTMAMLEEWVGQERLCCPFFDIDVHFVQEGGPVWLRLTGRPGTKEFMEADGAAWIRR
jgi:hypothetical protein